MPAAEPEEPRRQGGLRRQRLHRHELGQRRLAVDQRRDLVADGGMERRRLASCSTSSPPRRPTSCRWRRPRSAIAATPVSLTGGYKPASSASRPTPGPLDRERLHVVQRRPRRRPPICTTSSSRRASPYNFSHDTIGRTGTPFDVFSHNLDTHAVDAGVTIVLSPTTLLSVNGTGQFERGDQSKPYRYIPMFAPDIASRDPVGRDDRPREPVPPADAPARAAPDVARSLRARPAPRQALHRMNNATLRLDQRVYYDTWGTKASTHRRALRAGRRQAASASGRTCASTRRRARASTSSRTRPSLNSDGSITVPLFRSDDRELGPLITLTGGGGLRFGLTAPDSQDADRRQRCRRPHVHALPQRALRDHAYSGLRHRRYRRRVRLMSALAS